MKRIQCLVLHFVLIAGALPALFGQTTGTLTGTITDASGAVIPNVKVTATGSAANERRQTVTNQAGEYTLPFLPPGEYRIEFSVEGFTTVVQQVTLNIADRVAVNGSLQPSNVADRVEVSSAAPAI